jgi:hypothetical protein
MGLNPEALANATNPVGMSIMAQSQLLTKMIATIFANSGFKSLMEHIRELVLKYEDKEKIFDLTGEMLQTDPRSWRKERSSVVKVGIGFAGKQEEISVMNTLLTLQEKFIMAQGGQIDGALTNAKGIFNTVNRLCRRMGVKDAVTYFQDPSTYEPPAPQPTLAEKTLQLNQENLNAQAQIQDAKVGQDQQKLNDEKDYNLAKLQQDERLSILTLESNERIAEKELLYKYGKDSLDRHSQAMNPKPNPKTKEEKTNDGSTKAKAKTKKASPTSAADD